MARIRWWAAPTRRVLSDGRLRRGGQPAAGRPGDRSRRHDDVAAQPGRPGHRAASRSCAERRGAWIGWPGVGRRRRRAVRGRRHRRCTRCRCPPRTSRATTRASPTPRCGRSTTTSSSTPAFHRALVGRLRARSTSGSPTPPPRSPPRARPSGCRTTSCSWCRRCCASCGPTCGSGSSCTSRSRRSSCSCSCRGAREILEGLLGADLVGFQRRGGAQNFVRLRPAAARPPAPRGGQSIDVDGRAGAGRRLPDLDRRRRRSSELAATPRSQARAARDPRRARQPEHAPARRRPARLHQGHRRPARGVRRAARRRPARASTTRCWCRSPRPAGSGSSSYQRLRDDDRAAGRPHQRRATAGSAARPCTTCTSRCRREELAALYRGRRRHAGDAAARRHEPGRQGVRRLPQRRRRRAGAQRVHRRRQRAAGRRYLVNPHDIDGRQGRDRAARWTMPPEEARQADARAAPPGADATTSTAGPATFLDALRPPAR